MTEMTKIRNVALAGHGSAGKTSIAEALLFTAKATDRLGRIEDGNTMGDFDPEEVKRKFTINTHVLPFEWEGANITLLDCPGFADFYGEQLGGIAAADAVLIVVDGVSGVQVGTMRAFEQAQAAGKPVGFIVNRLDRERASFSRTMDSLKQTFGIHAAPLALAIGEETNFKGAVNLASGKAVMTSAPGKDETTDAPADKIPDLSKWSEALTEAVAESDDALLEKYLGGETFSAAEMTGAIKKAILSRKFFPVFAASGTSTAGVRVIADCVAQFFPSPADCGEVKGLDVSGAEITRKPDGPFSAFVFRTTIDPYAGKLSFVRVFSGSIKPDLTAAVDGKGNQKLGVLLEISGKNTKPITELSAGMIGTLSKMANLDTGDSISDPANPVKYPLLVIPEPVFSLALSPKSKQDEDKMSGGLDRIVQEDPTISVRRDPETHETVISGMGEIHIDVVLSRLKSRSGIEVETKTPRVAYRETIRQESNSQGRHKKQTGGRGQFGDVWLRIEPLPRSTGLEFVDKIVGGSVPGKFIPAVEKGVIETMTKGILAGYPVVDMRVTLYDGSYHTVDSSEIAFKLAARKALRKAFEQAKPCLLEPICSYDIVIPDDFYGAITADLSSKRGRILGSETKGKLQVVKALVPLAEMFRYCIDLRSMTGGQGTFTARFDHYEEVPQEVAKKVIEEAAKTREEEEEE